MRYGILQMLGGTLLAALACAPATMAQSEIPAGTRFLVELRDKLEARKIKPGKKFDARTREALRATDGSIIEAGRKVRGRVASVENNYVVLRFEQIDTGRGKAPLVATVRGVVGEKEIRKRAGDEGEIRSSSSRGRNAAIGAAVGAGLGVVIGATQGGSRAAVGTTVVWGYTITNNCAFDFNPDAISASVFTGGMLDVGLYDFAFVPAGVTGWRFPGARVC